MSPGDPGGTLTGVAAAAVVTTDPAALAPTGPKAVGRELPGPHGAPPPRRRGATWRMFCSELRLMLGRRRTQVLIGVLCLAPILLGIAVATSTSSPDSANLIARVAGNGVYLSVAPLLVLVTVFLPLVVGVVSADTIAGEAGTGTLRYLLTVPVGRTRLLVVKYLAVLAFCALLLLAIGAVGMVTGLILFPVGRVVLLSGTTVSFGAGVARDLAALAFVWVSLTGYIAVGLFLSTLTEVPIAAMAATVAVPVVSQILGNLSQVAFLHPYLFTAHWLDFTELLRTPLAWSTVGGYLLVQLPWLAIFATLAWARFSTKDVTS